MTTPPPNRRLYARKVLRATASVQLPSGPRDVRTWDVGVDGMSLVSPKPIAPGTRCTVTLDLPGGGPVSVAGKTVYCSLMGAEGFKVGLVFVNPDPQTEDAFRAFVA
ncbi:PilZ domain-containing protein [Piscinibacter sp. XHJ-5]|uniref:PilZ domain-containing protein n=1 Tax=Piscinibacter sp. XHJ-5 TaxID=3037797 RepID=UPI0024536991|nr:PilZ domain-containing protein [Piscinibacter sp. XHJ-5]